MLSTITRRRALDVFALVMVLVVSACASAGDSAPAVPAPMPFAAAPPATDPAPGVGRPKPRAAAPAPIPPPVRSKPRRSAPAPARATATVPVAVPVRVPATAPAVASVKAPVQPRTLAKVDSAALERAVTRRFTYEPLSLALAKRTRKSELSDRVAAAVVYEAERNRMSPSLLAAVLLIENAPFDTTAISSQGAVGLMQVMPMHRGSYGCPSQDLHSVEANICHGARLLSSLVRRSKSLPLALTRYNGCVRGRNTPLCHRYAGRVMRTASRLRHEVLVAAAGFTMTEEEPDLMAMDLPNRAAGVPSQPVLSTDTAAVLASPAECTSFVGCLRHRWTMK